MRLIDSCITQLKAQTPSRTCNESKEEEEKKKRTAVRARVGAKRLTPRVWVGLCYQLGGDNISVLSAVISLSFTDNTTPRVGAERPGECALVARPLVLHGAAAIVPAKTADPARVFLFFITINPRVEGYTSL